jgi:hypothetical protein
MFMIVYRQLLSSIVWTKVNRDVEVLVPQLIENVYNHVSVSLLSKQLSETLQRLIVGIFNQRIFQSVTVQELFKVRTVYIQ